MTEQIYLYSLIIVAMTFLLFVVKNSCYLDKKSNRAFLLAIISIIITFAAFICREVSEIYELKALNITSNIFIYSLGIFAIFFFIQSAEMVKGLWLKILFGIECLNLLLAISSIWSKAYFVVSDDGHYTRGFLFFIPFILAILNLGLWISCLMIKYKSLKWKDIIRIFSFGFLETVAVVFEIINDKYNLEYIGAAFIIILYYSFLAETAGKYDQLTNTLSRRQYYKNAESMKSDSQYSILLFDINNLKRINDEYGHSKGDVLIREIATSIIENVGKKGDVYRMGGDEFVAVIHTESAELIELILSKIKMELEYKSKKFGFNISASYGYSIHKNGDSIGAVLSTADKIMYINKTIYYSETNNNRRQKDESN